MIKGNLTSKSIRNNNSYNILKALVEQERLQRSELMAFSKVSVITVNKIVDKLLAAGVLEETTAESHIGRKPKELSFSKDLGCFCCINLCKTSQIGYFIYDIHARLLSEGRVLVSQSSEFVSALEACLRQAGGAARQLPGTLLGAAVSVPSVYYEQEDAVNYDLIPGLKDLHLKSLVQNTFGIENVIVIHDVCAAAGLEYQLASSRSKLSTTGELLSPAGSQLSVDDELLSPAGSRLSVGGEPLSPTESQLSPNESLYYFYLGDGLGSAYIRKGELIQGDSFAAGEIGQGVIVFEGEERTFESVLSISGLCNCLGLSGQRELEDFFRGYYNLNDKEKQRTDSILNIAAELLYNICWILNPGTIVIDSSVPVLADHILSKTIEKTRKLAASPIRNKVNVTLPKEKNHYAMPGCMMLLADRWIEQLSQEI